MGISYTVKSCLEEQSINYELIPHAHTRTSKESAGAAHVPTDHLAKAVIVKEDENYIMVVVPSDYHVHLGKLHHLLGRNVGLATEHELVSLFPDCEGGAIPPLGAVFQLNTLVDSSLFYQPVIYFESGDHEHLVKVTGEQFSMLLGDAERVNVATHH
ncbi:MAG: YbaK/EbsC family protein [Candidatus Thiodiazotropha sp. (ex Notomyrtea botanica)]|nr:YbaK/EbsC family protein [Candidatus Thiodiazotropha sp. (ex Notomyrtea botanica)]